MTSAMPHLRKFARPVDWGWLSNDPWPTLAALGRVTVWIVWYLPRGKNTWCQRILRQWEPRIGNWGHNPPKIVRLSKIRGVETIIQFGRCGATRDHGAQFHPNQSSFVLCDHEHTSSKCLQYVLSLNEDDLNSSNFVTTEQWMRHSSRDGSFAA